MWLFTLSGNNAIGSQAQIIYFWPSYNVVSSTRSPFNTFNGSNGSFCSFFSPPFTCPPSSTPDCVSGAVLPSEVHSTQRPQGENTNCVCGWVSQHSTTFFQTYITWLWKRTQTLTHTLDRPPTAAPREPSSFLTPRVSLCLWFTSVGAIITQCCFNASRSLLAQSIMLTCKSSYRASRQTCHPDITVITLTVNVDGPLISNLLFLAPLFLFELFNQYFLRPRPRSSTTSFCMQQLKRLTFA